MAEAGGIQLVATLDYGPALAALAEFKKQVTAIENSGQGISKLEDGLKRVGNQLNETLGGFQATAEQLSVVTSKTNELAAAREKDAAASAEESAAASAASDEMLATAEAFIQQQRAQTAAFKVQAAERAAAAKVVAEAEARTAADRVANFETARAFEAALLKQEVANAEARVAAVRESDAQILADRQFWEGELTAAHAEALAVNREMDAQEAITRKALGAARVADYQQIVALEATLEQSRIAAIKEVDAQILSDRLFWEGELTAAHAEALAANTEMDKAAAAEMNALHAEALAVNKRLDAEAAAERRALQNAAIADMEQARILEKAIEDQRVADEVRSDAEILARREWMERELTAAHIEALAVNKALDAKDRAERAAAEAVTGHASAGGAGKALGVKYTATESREAVTMGRDIATGEWGRLASSFTRFLTLAGAFDGILGPLGLSLAALGVTAGITAIAMSKGADEQNKLNLALASTGDYAGATAAHMDAIAEAAARMGGTIGSARELTTQLVETGRLTSGQIAQIVETAAHLQEAGGNVQAFIKQVESIKDNPTSAIMKLDEQYHFLTSTTYEAIAAAQRHGDVIGAAQLAVNDFSRAMDERTQDVIANQGLIVKGWNSIKTGISEAIDALMAFGKTDTSAEKIAALAAANREDQAHLSTDTHRDAGGGTSLVPGQFGAGNKAIQDRIALRTQEMSLLQETLRTENAAAEAAGRTKETLRSQVVARGELDALDAKYATQGQKRAAAELKIRTSLAPLVASGEITPERVNQLVDQANAKLHDHAGRKPNIDPTPYNRDQNAAQLAAAALKVAQDQLAVQKALGFAIDEQEYASVSALAIEAQKKATTAEISKIEKERLNAVARGNSTTAEQLKEQEDLVAAQGGAKVKQLQIDYQEQEVLRAVSNRLLQINTVLTARSSILKDLNTLYGTANDYDQNAIDNAAELAASKKAQYDQAVQYQQLVQSNASAGEIELAHQANVLNLATQIYAIEQERQKLLMDNATTLANIYQQTLNAVEQQIAAIEKGRTTLADQVVSGFTDGSNKANQSLFQSFKSPQTANKYTLQDYTSNIGGGLYDSITGQLAKSMTEAQLKGFQDLLKATGATSQADAARQKAQEDLASNTQLMTEALQVNIPDLLKQLIGLANGTITPSGPVGNAALNGGSGAASATTGSGAPYAFGSSKDAGDPAMSKQIDAANESLTDLGKTGASTFNALGLNATQFTSLFYTGVVAATSGGKQAFKNFAAYAITQLLELYAIQKLVGLATSAFNAYSANTSAAGTSTPDDLISAYGSANGHADGTSYIDASGMVTAPGGSRDDTALVRLSHGEGVLTANAVKRLGRERIDGWNKNRFADGGIVGGSPYAGGSSGGGSTSVAISVDASNKGGAAGDTQKAAQSGQLGKELEAAVLSVFSKYSQPGGPIYTQIKQLTR